MSDISKININGQQFDIADEKLSEEVEEIGDKLATVSGVPSTVKNAMLNLFSHLVYRNFNPTYDANVIRSWAAEITAIYISKSAISISGANTYQLSATTEPVGGIVTWSSTNSNVATVNESGLVTAVGNGSCRIIAFSGNATARCEVQVTGFADVTHISAVYTQTESVNPSTPINDLKLDLVVTAHYSDSTSRVISSESYSLSGTLTLGTSTITVVFGDKSTYFDVVVTNVLPSEYQSVEWIGRTSNQNVAGPYIDTGIHLDAKSEMNGYEISYTGLASVPSGAENVVNPLVSWSSNQACYFGSLVKSPNGVMGFYTYDGAFLDGVSVPVGEKHTFRTYWDDTNGTTVCNGISCSLNYIQSSADLNLRIGTGAFGSQYSGAFKIYGAVTVKKNNSVVRTLYPCYRKADNVIGFYCTTTRTFYSNAGSGSFEKGADV